MKSWNCPLNGILKDTHCSTVSSCKYYEQLSPACFLGYTEISLPSNPPEHRDIKDGQKKKKKKFYLWAAKKRPIAALGFQFLFCFIKEADLKRDRITRNTDTCASIYSKAWILPVYILSIVEYHECFFPLKIFKLRLYS